MSDLGLSLTTTDPNARLAARLAALEARVAAQEAHRDTTFTPVVTSWSIGIQGSSPATFTFNWNGGRLWLLAGGEGWRTGVGPLGWVYQIGSGGLRTPSSSVIAPTASSAIAFPMSMGRLDTDAAIVLGANTLQFGPAVSSGAYDYTVAQTIWIRGALIEWPQA